MDNNVSFDNSKPSFGSRPSTAPETSSTNTENKRSDIGAIWERTSKSNMKYMTLQLELDKEELLEKLKTSGDKFTLNLVAFINKYKEGNAKRPDFKIYEETPRG